jgi:UDP-N-acetylglucosamine:LPS N-acetylglucosamine transferase
MAFGPWPPGRRGNIRFEPFSETAFLDALASCAYVACGGGHTVISEALFFRKPVLSFPIPSQYEQMLNARYLERLGFGRCVVTRHPSPALLDEFEAGLPANRAAFEQHDGCGNAQIFDAVAHFIEHGTLPPEATGPEAG